MKSRETISSSEFRVSSAVVSDSREQWLGRATPCAPRLRDGRAARRGLTRPTFNASAFSLIEVMIVVVLMSVIILGLMAMFSQTQRAFKAGMTQTDVLEGGRTATEMLSRELEQIVPAYSTVNLGRTNFFTVLETDFSQTLPASTYDRTNLTSRIFFLTHENQTWTGIGYFLVADTTVTPVNPVGVLTRFEMSDNAAGFAQRPWLLISNFNLASQGFSSYGSLSKILDGVVHFHFRAYDTNGYWINPSLASSIGRIRTNSDWSPFLYDRVDYHFTSNAVPAFVEFELGILEQGALDKYKSIPISTAQSNYLSQLAGRVHLFRQRVAVRNVDRSAY